MISLDKLLKVFFSSQLSGFLIFILVTVSLIYALQKGSSAVFYPRFEKSRNNFKRYIYSIIIIICSILTITILQSWHSKVNELNIYENYIVLFISIFLFSGIFALLLHFGYATHTNAFAAKSDVIDILKDDATHRANRSKEISIQRIAEVSYEQKQLVNIHIPVIGILPYDKGNLPEFDALFKGSIDSDTGITVLLSCYWILELPSKNYLIFHRNLSSNFQNASDEKIIYLLKNNKKSILFDSKEVPTIDESQYFYLLQKNTAIIMTQVINQLFNDLKRSEEDVLEKLEEKIKTPDVLSLGYIWYFVLLFLAGSKIDYIIPVNTWTKFVILLLAFFRLIILGTFVSILVNKYK